MLQTICQVRGALVQIFFLSNGTYNQTLQARVTNKMMIDQIARFSNVGVSNEEIEDHLKSDSSRMSWRNWEDENGVNAFVSKFSTLHTQNCNRRSPRQLMTEQYDMREKNEVSEQKSLPGPMPGSIQVCDGA